MGFYVVKVSKEMLVEAEDKDDALNIFFERWEKESNIRNSTEMLELNDSANIRKATKRDILRF